MVHTGHVAMVHMASSLLTLRRPGQEAQQALWKEEDWAYLAEQLTAQKVCLRLLTAGVGRRLPTMAQHPPKDSASQPEWLCELHALLFQSTWLPAAHILSSRGERKHR